MQESSKVARMGADGRTHLVYDDDFGATISWCGITSDKQWAPAVPGSDVECLLCIGAISAGAPRKLRATPAPQRPVTVTAPRRGAATSTATTGPFPLDRAEVTRVLDERRRALVAEQASQARRRARVERIGIRLDEVDQLHDLLSARGWADPRVDPR